MATLEQLNAALVKADAAGNAADAKAFADEIRKMRAAPAPVAPGPDESGGFMQGVGNLAAGLLRGAGSIGATLLTPYDLAVGNTKSIGNPERRAGMDGGLQAMGAEPDSWMYKGGKLAGEIAGTAGAGGLVARGASAVPAIASRAPNLIQSIASGGMTTGGVGGTVANTLTRAAGGGISGAAQGALIDPNEAIGSGVVGAAMPGVFQAAGKIGQSVFNLKQAVKPNAGKTLADALGMTDAQLSAIISKAKSAPDELVPGSKLTLAQALQTQGANDPSIKMLERIAAGGPGGDVLLKRFEDQGAARLNALVEQGAETYQGAAKSEAVQQGNKIGAILRTQAIDDKAALRAAWEATYGRAAQDGVALNLPLDEMGKAMAPLGRGTVGAGNDARALMREANDIGTEILPGVAPLAKETASNSQTLERAVRAAGGIRGGSGELRDLGIRQSGTTGLINNKTGQSADILAEEMHRRGFIPDADPATLFDALRNGGGRKMFANDQVESNGMQRLAEQAMGDAPEAERIARAVPFDEFQRLLRSAGALGAKNSERAGGEAEAGVLNQLKYLLTQRADDAANGAAMSGDNITPDFLQQYTRARDLTRTNAEKYKGGNNITSILRKPVGQDYTLMGDEVANKLWHGGGGLSGDVANLKNVLSGNNYEPTMNALRKMIMTDAAGITTASGQFGSALPKYVENRLPGLEEAMTPEQLRALVNVAKDIRNAEAAAVVPGLRGSDTAAKITRAMDAGMLDSPLAKTLSKLLTFKGVGGEWARNKLAETVIEHKGRTISELLANPRQAAQALQDASFVQRADSGTLKALRLAASRTLPALAASQSSP